MIFIRNSTGMLLKVASQLSPSPGSPTECPHLDQSNIQNRFVAPLHKRDIPDKRLSSYKPRISIVVCPQMPST